MEFRRRTKLSYCMTLQTFSAHVVDLVEWPSPSVLKWDKCRNMSSRHERFHQGHLAECECKQVQQNSNDLDYTGLEAWDTELQARAAPVLAPAAAAPSRFQSGIGSEKSIPAVGKNQNQKYTVPRPNLRHSWPDNTRN